MDKEIQAEMQALYEALDRHGRLVLYNTARLINRYLGYEKYAVWVPTNEIAMK